VLGGVPVTSAAPEPELCGCGSKLRWEMSENLNDRHRWIAVCAGENCGRIYSSHGSNPDALQQFLLGSRPPHPYTPPWLRTVLRSSRAGFVWRGHHFACWQCGGLETLALELGRWPGREADPDRCAMCIDCGALMLRFVGWAELGTVLLDADAWYEPDVSMTCFLRALKDREAILAGYQEASADGEASDDD
jgi:hypothetical protein